MGCSLPELSLQIAKPLRAAPGSGALTLGVVCTPDRSQRGDTSGAALHSNWGHTRQNRVALVFLHRDLV